MSKVKCLSRKVSKLINSLSTKSSVSYTNDVDLLLSMKREELAEFLAITNFVFKKTKSEIEFV